MITNAHGFSVVSQPISAKELVKLIGYDRDGMIHTVPDFKPHEVLDRLKNSLEKKDLESAEQYVDQLAGLLDGGVVFFKSMKKVSDLCKAERKRLNEPGSIEITQGASAAGQQGSSSGIPDEDGEQSASTSGAG